MTPNQLPPLPEPRKAKEFGYNGDVFTADQMHAYALTALAQQAQEPVAWLHEWVPGAPVIGKELRFTSETVHGDAVRVRPLIYGDTTPQPHPANEITNDMLEAWALRNGVNQNINALRLMVEDAMTIRGAK